MMNSEQINNFINQLTSDTLAGKIAWESLLTLEAVEETTNLGLHCLLTQNEYHHIHYVDSYYASLCYGMIFLIHETRESGRDNVITNGYHIYIQNAGSDKTAELLVEQGYIYQLLQTVKKYVQTNDESAIEINRFISNYFNR